MIVAVPLALAIMSPLLQWRSPVYIAAGIAGILGLALMVFQPLLVSDVLPGVRSFRGRRIHRVVGICVVLAVVVHVGALWVTSPPDVIDVLLFRSPAPFSVWGAIAMWAVLAAAGLALLRRRMRLGAWRIGHTMLVSLAVVTTVLHAVLIEGTMEPVTKAVLCAAAVFALGVTIWRRRVWVAFTRRP